MLRGSLNRIPEPTVSTVRVIVALSDPEASHLVLQGGTFKAEAFGRSAVTRDLPGRRLQCLEDDFPLGFMEGRGRARNVVSNGILEARRLALLVLHPARV